VSKPARSKRKLDRLKQKRARKIANQTRYLRWKEEGKNTKSKRSRAKARKNKLVKDYDHSDGYCGNVACHKCYGVKWRFAPFLNKKGVPTNMPHKLYLLWRGIQ
jgi:hypothetical protein